jgi:DNA-binding HxlR family transcriptional regulator
MTNPHQQACPIAASLNQLGDAWTLLIVREARRGISRFSDFQKNTGIAKNLLAQRLTQMVEHGIFEKHDIGNLGKRFEYRLTAKGKALAPMMATIIQWGNEWVFGSGNEPVKMVSRKTGAAITSVLPSDGHGTVFEWDDVAVTRGPATRRNAQNDDPKQEQGR